MPSRIGLKLLAMSFLAKLGLDVWPYAKPFFTKYRAVSVLFFLLILALILSQLGCATPRSNFIAGLQYSQQAPKTLIDLQCQGKRRIYEGVAVCEEKTPRIAEVWVKIMPVPGRVVYSDGLKKKTDDFNWRKEGWIWKNQVIDRTWAKLDVGELNSIYGDVPLAFAVQGLTSVGVINTHGIIYHRMCNDRDIPCSSLIVHYDCSGKRHNTAPGQIGSCARISGSSQDFSLPLTANNALEGAVLLASSGRSSWKIKHTITKEDLERGEFKFQFPSVQVGPELIRIDLMQREQGVPVRYINHVLIVGYSPEWTGIDNPHFFRNEWCMPFTADLMEVDGDGQLSIITKDCVKRNAVVAQTCAYAYDRESGDSTYTCIKDGKNVRFP